MRRYGFDALIVIAALEAALEVALRHDALGEPSTTPWIAVPAVTLVVLPLLARRRFPFAAPVAVWLVAAALSFVDGRLVVFAVVTSIAGLAASFLLGNRDAVQARAGLVVLVGCSAIVVYNDPDHDPGELIFIPVLFAIGWLAGFALHERAVQVEAAEERASYAEREREAAAQLAAAEERARIARELHDIVAHAVSVMVLQVGAVRHRLPQTLEEDRNALTSVERAGRTALTEMRRLLGAMRSEGEEAELAPQRGLDGLDALLAEVGRAGLPVRLHFDERRPLPRAIDLAVYRIVQEGLTNALTRDVSMRTRPTSGAAERGAARRGSGATARAGGVGRSVYGRA